MTKTQDDIDNIARRTRDAGVPDHLNRWLGMTPEKLEESEDKIKRQFAADRNRRGKTMPKIGAKEQALRVQREETEGTAATVAPAPAPTKPRKPAKAVETPKVAQTKARTPVVQATGTTPSAGRPAEKQVVIKKLLARKNGCTAKEVMAACNWPSVSMPQQAKALDITLHKKKVEGQPTRYADHPLD
jgi:uncharacterized protein (DUF2342 family)